MYSLCNVVGKTSSSSLGGEPPRPWLATEDQNQTLFPLSFDFFGQNSDEQVSGSSWNPSTKAAFAVDYGRATEDNNSTLVVDDALGNNANLTAFLTSLAWNSSTILARSFLDAPQSSTMKISLRSNMDGHPTITSLPDTTPRPSFVNFLKENLLENVMDNFENISSKAREWYDDFEHVSEAYILTSIAGLGILFNFLAITILSWDRRIWPMSRILNNLFLYSEQVFLAIVIVYLQLRSWYDRSGNRRNYFSTLELFNYLTAALGAAQTFAAWMLYVVAVDAYRSVRQLTISEKIFQIRRSPLYVVVLVLIVGGFYSAYLPPVRVELYRHFNSTDFVLCNVPLENHWDFITVTGEQRSDLYYVLYYSVGYTVLAYVVPFFLVCCRDKDIIDVLHSAQEQKALLPTRSYVLCPAVAISVACNVYLVCVALKMVILTFKIFEYADDYVTTTAFIFFRYLNVYSNFLQVLKSSLHFFIMLIYNKRLRKIVVMRIRKT